MTITRVGTTQKYAVNWDIAFSGKRPSRTAEKGAAVKAAPVKSAKKKASPKKKAAAAPVKKKTKK